MATTSVKVLISPFLFFSFIFLSFRVSSLHSLDSHPRAEIFLITVVRSETRI